MSLSVSVPRLGRYTLLRSLGAGGMAELFLARSDGIEGFAKLVAVKRILPHKATNERFVRMLLNEARLVAGLDHPNIAQVHDIGLEHGEYFFSMEYVHGQDLSRVLRRAPHHKLSLENALYVAIGVCAGLHYAHIARDNQGRALDIVHRDVSPSNVLISYQGAVKLVDFGVAKATTLVSETREGVIKGKYGYMSPEQCLGEALDRRSDVFAVGILLWELTVGRRLYQFKSELASLQRIVYSDAPPPSRFDPSYPRLLEQIVMRALSRDVRHRYQSAEELQLDLEQYALDHRLAISGVALASEMKRLFHDQVEAWSLAERAGQSLGEHLAAVSPPPPVDLAADDYHTSEDEAPAALAAALPLVYDNETRPDSPVAIDGGVDDRTAQLRGMTRRPSSPGPVAMAMPMPVPPLVAPSLAPLTPHQLSQQLRRSQATAKLRPSRSVPVLLILLVVMAIAAGWLVLFQHA